MFHCLLWTFSATMMPYISDKKSQHILSSSWYYLTLFELWY